MTGYVAHEVEQRWAEAWEAAETFHADATSGKPPFSIAVPPASISSVLHMGHALQAVVQDIWARYRRMTGHEVLWLPGTDHAAIGTQDAVERAYAAEGRTKEEVGRAAFDARVAEWYQEKVAIISQQYREMGSSLDFSRQRFTMDGAYGGAVRTAFVHFWERGLLYRGARIVNRCADCGSTISNMEVVRRDVPTTVCILRVALQDGSGELEIATTRPELLVAATAVAVDASDQRWTWLRGRSVILPFGGRAVPVVPDASLRRHPTGAAAVPVMPAHDAHDWELAQLHHLDIVLGLDAEGLMDAPGQPFHGMTVTGAREVALAVLRADGPLVAARLADLSSPCCDRCAQPIETMLSEQWFMRTSELAAAVAEAHAAGRVRWHPERYGRLLLAWLQEMEDWCISRQLWFGHRIPFFTCEDGHGFAAVDEPISCPTCGTTALTQDSDVLDTWFSSALWPFATLGWPEPTDDLAAFYPTALSVTTRHIIGLGASRMLLAGLELTGTVPFADVLVTCDVLASDGLRMRTARGNAVDPSEIVRRHGADALRGWAAGAATTAQDVRFDEPRVAEYRRFCNKLWHGCRLVAGAAAGEPSQPTAPAARPLLDRWILSRTQELIATVTASIEGHVFHEGIAALYDLAVHDLGGTYLAAVRPHLHRGDPAAVATATSVYDVVLRLLHPFMPFVTEDLWHQLPGDRDFLVRAPWPSVRDELVDPAADQDMAAVNACAREARQAAAIAGCRLRGARLQPGASVDPAIAATLAVITETVLGDIGDRPAVTLVHVDTRLELAADASAKVEASARSRLEHDLARLTQLLENPGFVGQAPDHVVASKREQLARTLSALTRLGA